MQLNINVRCWNNFTHVLSPICQDMKIHKERGEEGKGEERRRIYPLKMSGRDVHYPINEPKLVLVESLGREKACPDFLKPARRFGAKIMPPRMSHKMSECLG